MVDDASQIKPPAELQAEFDKENAKYEQWLAKRKALQADAAAGVATAVQALASGDYSFCNTTSHKQIRSDYCGRATCTIIDHYLRGVSVHMTQNEWAAYRASDGAHLWTDASGAVMWVMAEGLRAKTGRGFAHTYGNDRNSMYNRTSYSLTTYHRIVWEEVGPGDDLVEEVGWRLYAAPLDLSTLTVGQPRLNTSALNTHAQRPLFDVRGSRLVRLSTIWANSEKVEESRLLLQRLDIEEEPREIYRSQHGMLIRVSTRGAKVVVTEVPRKGLSESGCWFSA